MNVLSRSCSKNEWEDSPSWIAPKWEVKREIMAPSSFPTVERAEVHSIFA
jgi:hypothetical protein